MSNKPTQDQLHKLFSYDSNTGIFRYRVNQGNRHIGDIAGCLEPNGYIKIRIYKKSYRAHRLAWLYIHGYMPTCQIDHKNLCRRDNRIDNLREANNSTNHGNMQKSKRNTSGYKGVSLHKKSKRWVAYITVNCKRFHLGYHDTPESAHAAYLASAREHFGQFARG